MQSSGDMKRRSGWSRRSRVWIALAVAIAAAFVIALAVTAGGGSTGLY